MSRREQYYRLRNDVGSGIMQLDTLKLILKTHKRNPWQALYIFDYRTGPDDRVSIYDMDLPRRKALVEEVRVGYEEADWWHSSFIANVPNDYIPRIRQVDRNTNEVIRSGYMDILKRLLSNGSVPPSSCLDTWLGEDSRKFCAMELRTQYLKN